MLPITRRQTRISTHQAVSRERVLSATSILLLLPRTRRPKPKHDAGDPEYRPQHPAHQDEVNQPTTPATVIQLILPSLLFPSCPMPRALNLAMCPVMALLIEMPHIVVETARETSRPCSCGAGRPGLRFTLRFVGMGSLTRVFASLFGVLAPASTFVE